jgi:hypothetical protein
MGLWRSGSYQVTTRPAGEHPTRATRDRPTRQRQGTKAGHSKGQTDPGNAPGSSQSQHCPVRPVDKVTSRSPARVA